MWNRVNGTDYVSCNLATKKQNTELVDEVQLEI